VTVCRLGTHHKPNRLGSAQPVLAPDDPEFLKLDVAVPAGHKARLIDQLVDQLDLASLIVSYAGRGLPPYPPELMLKMVLYEIHEGRTRPTQWAKDLAENIPLKWLVRGIRPSLSRLYVFLKRLAPHLDGWMHQVLELATERGWDLGKTVSLDGTFVEANASRHHVLNNKRLERRIEQLEAAVDADGHTVTGTPSQVAARLASESHALGTEPSPPATTAPAEPQPGPLKAEPRPYDRPSTDTECAAHDADKASLPKWMGTTTKGRQRQLKGYREAKRQMDRLQKQNARRPKDKRKKGERIVVSATDPESAYGKDKKGTYRPLYNAQVVRDVNSPFILAADAFAQPSDSGTLPTMLEQTREAIGRKPENVLTDSGYVTPADMEHCQRQGVNLVGPYQQNDFTAAKANAKQPKQIPKDAFSWDPVESCFRCPEGHSLPFVCRTTKQRTSGETIPIELYRCDPAQCMACPRQQACTTVPHHGRTVRRHPQEDLIRQHRQRMAQPESKALYRHRGATIELVFADLKTHRNLGRLTGRGLPRAKTEVKLMALAYNLVALNKPPSHAKPGCADESDTTCAV
jgi:transposase